MEHFHLKPEEQRRKTRKVFTTESEGDTEKIEFENSFLPAGKKLFSSHSFETAGGCF